MNLSQVKEIMIPEGKVKNIKIGNRMIWTMPSTGPTPPPLFDLGDTHNFNLLYRAKLKPSGIYNGTGPLNGKEAIIFYDVNNNAQSAAFPLSAIQLISIQDSKNYDIEVRKTLERSYTEMFETDGFDTISPALPETYPNAIWDYSDGDFQIFSGMFYIKQNADIRDAFINKNYYLKLSLEWNYKPQIIEGKEFVVLVQETNGEWIPVEANYVKFSQGTLFIDILRKGTNYKGNLYENDILEPHIIALFMFNKKSTSGGDSFVPEVQ